MATPSIAHFGTTIVEPPPPDGVDQKDVPITGALAETLEFLDLFGFEPLVANYYPGVGRQYIWRRGAMSDADYLEKDSFTSYRARPRPATAGPREGDVVFRLPHREPVAVYRAWLERNLVRDVAASDEAAFLAGERAWLLLRGPDGQCYELGTSQPERADNHRVYVWTAADKLADVRAAYGEHFGFEVRETDDFHGVGKVELLARSDPPMSLGLLFDPARGLFPRWTDDIFVEAGYSHFRLGAPDMAKTLQRSREAFPQAGDVAFVHFENSYLELVQAR